MTSDTIQEPKVHAVADLTAVRRSNRGPFYRFAFELQRRRVSRAALSYALIMWLSVQIGDVVFPMAGLPDWTLRLIVAIGVMGLPLIIFLAWTFQITLHGIVVDVGSEDTPEKEPQRVVDMAINVALLLLGLALATYLAAELAFADTHDSYAAITEDGAVAEPGRLVTSVSFSTASNQSSRAFVNGVEAEVRHRLIQLPNVTVVSDATSKVEHAHSSSVSLLSGTLFLDDEQVHVLVQLLDVASNEYRWTKGFDVSIKSLLEAEEAIAERITSEIQSLLDGAEPNDEQTNTTTAGSSEQPSPVAKG